MIIKKNDFLFYGISVLLTCVILLTFLYSHGFHLSVLPNYEQDGLALGVFVKTFIHSGFYFQNPQLGVPGIYDLSAYPLSDDATLLILKCLSLLSSNYIVVLNLFFISSFVLVTVISLFGFQYLGLNKPFALAASLLFTFLPYPFLRMQMGHLFLCTYYVVPIYVLLIFAVLRQTLFFGSSENTPGTKKRYILILITVVACVFSASSGLYYAFFASYLLLFVGIIASIEKKRWFPLGNAGIIILLISLTIILNGLPAIHMRMEQGPNQSLVTRTPAESEYYGLKIVQLLLPIDEHRILSIAKFKANYNATAPLINENRTATLGIIGSVGFLVLLFILLVRSSSDTFDTLFDLSRLNIAAVLLSTVGGLSTLFSYLISPMIRGYNRISVFIAFFSLAAFFLFFQEILKKRSFHHRNTLCWSIALLIVLLGIFDQIPPMNFSRDQTQFINDEKFVTAIEAKMPAGTMIMQLPYMDFPESPAINGMNSYDLFRGYLHSHQLKWSFGAMRGRGAAMWQNAVAQEPAKEMINDLAYAGFTGLYIFRKGYADQGQAIEKQIAHLLHTSPLLVNEQNTIAFYDLRPYIDQLRRSMSFTAWQSQVARVQTNIAWLNSTNVVWGDGLYTLEKNKTTNWHWSNRTSELQVYNFSNHDIKVKLECVFRTGYPTYATLWISGDLFNEILKVNQAGTPIQREFIVPPGKHIIHFKTDAKQVDSGADPRELFFAIYDFSFTRLS